MRKISHQKTTFGCPALGDVPVCDPKLRGCLEWINAKQGLPELGKVMTATEASQLAAYDRDAPRGSTHNKRN